MMFFCLIIVLGVIGVFNVCMVVGGNLLDIGNVWCLLIIYMVGDSLCLVVFVRLWIWVFCLIKSVLVLIGMLCIVSFVSVSCNCFKLCCLGWL